MTSIGAPAEECELNAGGILTCLQSCGEIALDVPADDAKLKRDAEKVRDQRGLCSIVLLDCGHLLRFIAT